MQCQEREYSGLGGHWMDCRRQPRRGGAERERASSTTDPQCIIDTRGSEHRSDAAMRGYRIFENALMD